MNTKRNNKMVKSHHCKMPSSLVIMVFILVMTITMFPIAAPVGYYRALACYDPQLQSPNEDGLEEELGFLETDIIVVSAIFLKC